MVTRAFAAGAAIVLLALPASAEQLPGWDIADICQVSSAPGQCRLFEAHARNVISSSWDLLPSDIQAACIAATRSPADQSWRTLADCIEVEVLRARAERTIATRTTREEMEPPAPAEPEVPVTGPAMPGASVAPAAPDQPAEAAAPPGAPGTAEQ